jgi:hypothetical protein
MNHTKRCVSKLGIALSGMLLGYPVVGQPSVSVAVSVPLPTVEIRVESDFYEPLTPHGEWVVVGSHGRCWRPARVDRDWRPYCNGYWQRTEAGWYWVSDEPWSWATYHYGRWDFDDQYGWYWVPQTQWAPAWVSWHEGGGYVGWAPLQPSVSISVRGYVGFNQARLSPRAFVFVEQRRFLEPVRPTTVVVNNTTIINKTTIISNTKVVNNTVINEGPATTIIEKASGRKVEAVTARELRHKHEEPVVSKQRTAKSPAENKVQTPPVNEADSREKKAGAASAPQVAAPAPAPAPVVKPVVVPTESTRPAPPNREPRSEKRNPVPDAPDLKPARPEARPPGAIEEPTAPKNDKRLEKQADPANPPTGKGQQPAKQKPAGSDKKAADPAADKDHEKKSKE